jgi:membrane protein
MPASAHHYLMQIIEDLTKIKRGGLLSIGFVLALYFSSNGLISLMRGFDKTYKASFRNRSIFYKRGIALMLTFLLGLLFIFSITLIIFSDIIFNWLADHINNSKISNTLFFLSKAMFTFGILYMGIWLIYHYGPSLRKKLPFINPGTIVASILSLSSSLVFAHFVNNFGKFNEIYGSIGALIVILLWIKINAFILLVGFELNAAIAVNRDIKNLENH